MSKKINLSKPLSFLGSKKSGFKKQAGREK
ncbi:MAG: hypothetical protein PWQ54_1639 [Bacteroidales bacterium]|jgi:hypothetical protein|nr:hypothetical protein [Bacteroidales bacterium]